LINSQISLVDHRCAASLTADQRRSAEPLIRPGALILLLCPGIDYAVTFARFGRADARPAAG
jgi:hypothetical protein